MLTLFDYLPSRNAWKVRQLLRHLRIPHRTQFVSIFDGEGRTPEYRRVNPTGAVPAIALGDGRVLAESNAILGFLAESTPLSPSDAFARAKVQQWLSFEQQYVEMTLGSLRYWTLTGKLQRRSEPMVEARRDAAMKALRILDEQLGMRPFIAGEDYTIADISLFAYASRAEEAGLPLQPHPNVRAWIARVEAQPDHLADVHPYSIDPHSERELC